MNFCPRCGAPFKTTASPTPIYHYSPLPSGQLTPINYFHLSDLWISAVLWVFVGFLFELENISIFHLPIIPVIALTACGAFIGVYATRKYTLRLLAVLDAKGEIKTSQKKTIIFVLIAIAAVITATVLVLVYGAPDLPSYWLSPISLLYPLPTAVLGTQAIMYSKWQKVRHKQIFYEKKRILAIPNKMGNSRNLRQPPTKRDRLAAGLGGGLLAVGFGSTAIGVLLLFLTPTPEPPTTSEIIRFELPLGLSFIAVATALLILYKINEKRRRLNSNNFQVMSSAHCLIKNRKKIIK
jgi:hypothetical protein